MRDEINMDMKEQKQTSKAMAVITNKLSPLLTDEGKKRIYQDPGNKIPHKMPDNDLMQLLLGPFPNKHIRLLHYIEAIKQLCSLNTPSFFNSDGGNSRIDELFPFTLYNTHFFNILEAPRW